MEFQGIQFLKIDILDRGGGGGGTEYFWKSVLVTSVRLIVKFNEEKKNTMYTFLSILFMVLVAKAPENTLDKITIII